MKKLKFSIKSLKYLTVPLAAIFNAQLVWFAVSAKTYVRHNSIPLSHYVTNVACFAVIGVILAVLSIKILADGFDGLKHKKLAAWGAFGVLVAAVGVCVAAFVSQNLTSILITLTLLFAALFVFVGALYTVLAPWLKTKDKLSTVLSASVGSVLCVLSPVMVVFCVNLIKQQHHDRIKGLSALIGVVSAVFFIFGVAVLVGAFVKNHHFSWTKPTAALIAGMLVCVLIFAAFATSAISGSYNVIKNVAVDIGFVRLVVSEANYVCAYKGIGGERIYLLSDLNADNAELSELLGARNSKTVGGVVYEQMSLENFGGYFVFIVVPA